MHRIDRALAEGPPTDGGPTRLHPHQKPATAIAPGPADGATRLRGEGSAATALQPRRSDPPPAAPANAEEEPEAGRNLLKDRFVLEDVLGVGGMGVVYRATDLRKREAGDEDAAVAVKVLSKDFSSHPDALIVLQREAKKAQLLAHPNVITVYDFDRDGDTVFMTMELLSGQPLRSYIEHCGGRPGRRSEQLSIIRQIAMGLQYAHSRGLVHSDLKPDNIFITDRGQVKILDFGIARAFSEDYYRDSYDVGALGAYTPRYASRGIVSGKVPAPTDDIYALGIMACELLGGKHPYRSRDAVAAADAGETPALPPRINPLLRRLLRDAVGVHEQAALPKAERFLRRLDRAVHWRKNAALAVALLCVVAATNAFLVWHYQHGKVGFDELPPASQEKVLAYLAEAGTAMRFDDTNGALLYLDKAHAIHPDNEQVAEQVGAVLARVRKFARDHPERARDLLKQVKTLEGYAAVRGNDAYYPLLAELRSRGECRAAAGDC